MQSLEGHDVVRGGGCEVAETGRPPVVADYALGLDAALLAVLGIEPRTFENG